MTYEILRTFVEGIEPVVLDWVSLKSRKTKGPEENHRAWRFYARFVESHPPQRCKHSMGFGTRLKDAPNAAASPRVVARSNVVQHLLFDGWVGIHGQRQSTLGTKQSTSAMQESLAKSPEAEEIPKSRSFSAGSMRGRIGNHLQLAG